MSIRVQITWVEEYKLHEYKSPNFMSRRVQISWVEEYKLHE